MGSLGLERLNPAAAERVMQLPNHDVLFGRAAFSVMPGAWAAGGDGEPGPGIAALARPRIPEKTLATARGGQDPETAVGGGEHGAEGVVELVGDIGGFVDDEQGDGGEAAERIGIAWKGDEPGMVGEQEGVRMTEDAADGDVEGLGEADGFVE